MMKKLICVLLTLCMLLSAANVLAFEQVVDKDGNKVYTKVTTPLKADSGVDDSHTAWEFKSPTGFYYTVIPDDVVTVNGKKQYLFISNTYYGKIPGASTALTKDATKEERAKFIFDPESTISYAYWLNNEFLNSSKAADSHDDCTGAALDNGIRDYIVEHDWLVEGYGSETTGYANIDEKYYYDYKVKSKVALLSTTELVKYGKYMKQSLKFANGTAVPANSTYSCILRTFAQLGSAVNNGVFIKRYVQSSGNTGNSASNYCGIRPIFYVSEDYFKNVKLDLNTAGSEVRKIIAELNPDIYSDDEKLSLKGIYTLTEDGSKELSADEWTNATKAAVDESAIAFKNCWIARNLPETIKGGIVTIETQIFEVPGNGLHIGFSYDGDSSPNYKYPLYIANDKIIKYYSATSGANNTQSYKRLDNNDYDLNSGHFKFPKTLKLTVNLSDGNCYVSISGEPDGTANKTDKVRYSLGTTKVSSYIDSNKTFSQIAFWSNDTNNLTKMNNIKITYDPNGNAIKSVNKIGNKKIEITVDDYVDLTNVTKDSICLTANTVTDITKNGNKIIATLEKNLTNGEKCVIVNDMKRNDVGNANYTIIGNSAVFTVAAPNETQIGVPVISGELTSGKTVSAVSGVIGIASTDAKPVQFVIAAYNGDRLIGAKVANVENVNTVDELKAEITLSENATEIRAFIWDSNNYPICKAVSKN